jgi:hypothetical protein
MGFYFRKSVNVGLFRLNLSKSGIGISTGVKGLRAGFGPRGTYVSIGAGGLYYRQTLSHRARSSRAPPAELPGDTSHGEMREIASGEVAAMTDATSASFLAELNDKRRQHLLWPIVAAGAALVIGVLAWNAVSPWVIGPVVAVLSACGIAAALHDIHTKTIAVLYDLDSTTEQAFNRLCDSLQSIAKCGGAWRVNAAGDVFDPKYHAGAAKLIARAGISVQARERPFFKTNVLPICVPAGQLSLYFLPDRLLVYDASNVGAVEYGNLQILHRPEQFIEDGPVPSDARVVGRTWQFVNRNGSPDRRFNNNRELPVCEYEAIGIASETGLRVLLQVSRVGVGAAIVAGVEAMAHAITDARAAETRPRIVQQNIPRAIPVARLVNQALTPSVIVPGTPPDQDSHLHDCLLDLICCVIVSDGHLSRREKQRVCEIMRQAGSPSDDDELHKKISDFVERVKQRGFRHLLAESLSQVAFVKQCGQEDLVSSCVEMAAGADGKQNPPQAAVCEQIKRLLA